LDTCGLSLTNSAGSFRLAFSSFPYRFENRFVMFRIRVNQRLSCIILNRNLTTTRHQISSLTSSSSHPKLNYVQSSLRMFPCCGDVPFLNTPSKWGVLKTVKRHSSRQSGSGEFEDKRKATVMFISAVGILVLSLSYAAVPLYRLFCQVGITCGLRSCMHRRLQM
jgi:hypothetical protein